MSMSDWYLIRCVNPDCEWNGDDKDLHRTLLEDYTAGRARCGHCGQPITGDPTPGEQPLYSQLVFPPRES
jgi:hypothetical protein